VFTGAIMLYDNINKTSAGQIVNNEIIGAQSGGRGVDIVWAHNRITNFGYGAGIFSDHDGVGFGTHNWTIIGNSITGGQPARDANGFYPKGIEVYAPRTRIIGNTCYDNSGSGIVFGGRCSIVANNSCFNNGLSDNNASGIVATYVPPHIDPSNSIVTGNTCRNIGAGFQHYGFSDAGVRIATSGLHFSGNDFSGNLLGEFSKAATSSLYNWIDDTLQGSGSWTPGTIAAGGTASHSISIPGAVVGGNIAWAGFDMLTSDNLIITAKVYTANTAKATIFNPTAKPITLGAGRLYIVVQKKAP
jgi:hypothetical protein